METNHSYRANRIQTTNVLVSILGLLLLLSLPKYNHNWGYFGTLQFAGTTLKGQIPYSDIATDFYGFRALVLNQDPYAILGPALETMGIDWDVTHSSTHPPTAYLLTAPVAFLPWPLASALWAWLMLVGLIFSIRLFGYPWKSSFSIAIAAVFWPPTATSLGNITIIWLLGLMLAYKYRENNVFLAGIFIGISSYTKFFSALLIIPFIARRKWQAVIGFIFTWLAGLTIITILEPTTIYRYILVNRSNSIEIIMREDNASFLAFLFRYLKIPGLVAGILFIAIIVYLGMPRAFKNTKISVPEWNLFCFLSVILLPIAWIYSILPLLTIILSALQQKGVLRYYAITVLILPILSPRWGILTPFSLFVFFILMGVIIVLGKSSINRLSESNL